MTNTTATADLDLKAMADEVAEDLRKIDIELRGNMAKESEKEPLLDASESSPVVPEVAKIETLGLKLTRLSSGNARLCVTRGPEPEACVEGSEETAQEIMALLKKAGLVE